MVGKENARRIAAECIDCGSAYAARLWPDGNVRIIGLESECPCGGTRFVNLTAESEDPFEITPPGRDD